MAYSKNRRLADIITDTSGNIHVHGITVPTQSDTDNDTSAASTAFVHSHVNALIDSAPGTLNTLNEIAAALNDDPTFTTTVNNAIATKLPLAGGTMTGNIAHAGTFTLDVGGNLVLDADSGEIQLKDGGTTFGELVKSGNDFRINQGIQDGNFVFRGNDGGSIISALTIDISDAGFSKFNGALAVQGQSSGHLASSGMLSWDSNSMSTVLSSYAPDATAYGHIAFKTGYGGAAPTTKVTIDGSGSVGIGTTTPSAKLQISGGNIALDGDRGIDFLTQSSTAYGKIYASDYPSKGYTASGSGSTVLNRYWPTISSAGGVFLVLNTDGGTGSSENAMDSFVVWQGDRDGDQLLKVSNAGNTSTRRLALNSAGDETTFIPDGSGLNRVDLMIRSYTSGEHHGQVIACDNDGEAHLMMVDTANSTGSSTVPAGAGGWGLDIYYDGSAKPYNLRTGQGGTWTARERIAFDGTREFMNSDLQHNDSYKSVQWKWVTTPYYWYASTTSATSTSIAYNGFTTNGNATMPSNIKALYVTYYYHISGYSYGSVGQGDHASDIWGPDAPSGTTSWSFTTSGNVDWGSAVFMHDGDASESGDMLYYGAWFPGAIIPVNSNGSIYGLLGHGHSGGTHYHHMYVWGYAT